MRRLSIVSGAGLSVDSGIRAFRTDTANGKAMWDEYDLEEVCDIHAFRGQFYWKTHEFYNKRRQELRTVEPNIAHLRIGEWFQRYPEAVLNITTNVDDLLERAGVPKSEVLHVHGYLPEVRIKELPDRKEYILDVGYTAIDPDEFYWAKPNVVFFGEAAPEYALMHATFDSLTANDMVIVVGCSNQVINFNWELFPALARGTKMMVVNPTINYLEQSLYEERGVTVWRAGAAEVFGNKHFIGQVEAFMEGTVYAPQEHV